MSAIDPKQTLKVAQERSRRFLPFGYQLADRDERVLIPKKGIIDDYTRSIWTAGTEHGGRGALKILNSFVALLR